MQGAQGQVGLDALAAGVADTDQHAGGERHRLLARGAQRLEPNLRQLVRAAVVRSAAPSEARRHRLQHQASRDRDFPQARDLLAAHDAGVDVRQQPGGLVHLARDRGEIVDGAVVTESGERLAGDAIACLGPVAEGEQGLVAAGRGAGARDGDGLLDAEIGALHAPRRAREGAVAAHVTAQARERNEDLGRVRDDGAVAAVAQPSSGIEERVEPAVPGEQPHVGVAQSFAVPGTLDDRFGVDGH